MLKKFWAARNGNVAMMFGLLIIPLILAGGIAADMMRIGKYRAQMNEAADSGILAAARAKMLDGTLTIAEAETIARRYFDANGGNHPTIEIHSFTLTHDTDEGSFRLVVTGQMQTALIRVAGNEYVPINIDTQAKVTPAGPIETVMVLDNTGSMAGQKLADLKSAAHMLTDMLVGSGGGQHRVALVPFAQYVNVGTGNVAASWIDASGLPTSGGDDDDDDDDDDGGGTPIWDGCVGSRNYPLNLHDSNFDTTPVPAITASCPDPILPLTNNKSAITGAINAMDADGWTYIATGLSWGLRVISDGAPFTEGLSTSDITSQSGIKAIILLTDGANTRAPSYPEHDSSDAILADNLTAEMCTYAKAQGIRIYTIAFEVTDATTVTLMSDCASTDGGFFDAGNGAALTQAFSTIGVSLTDLALTK